MKKLSFLLLVSFGSIADSTSPRVLTEEYSMCRAATHYYWNYYQDRKHDENPYKNMHTMMMTFGQLENSVILDVEIPYGLVAKEVGQNTFYGGANSLREYAPEKLEHYVVDKVQYCLDTYESSLKSIINDQYGS